MVFKKSEAFTLVELVIVAIVIAGLALLFGRGIMRRWEGIRKNQTKATISVLKGAVTEYYAEQGKLPDDIDEVHPYTDMKAMPKDGWDHEFEYNKQPDLRFKDLYRRYEIISYGPDGIESDNDIHDGE